MGVPGDDRVTDPRTHREPAPARRFGAGEAEVIPFRPRRESLAQRLERERLARERADRARREKIERERAARERAIQERIERRREARLEQLRREREALRHRRPPRSRRRSKTAPTAQQAPAQKAPAQTATAQVRPSVAGPVRKRERAAENRQRAADRRKGLVWPTAKAGFAVTMIFGLSVALGTLLGLPVPGLDAGSGPQSLAASASVFGLDPGTPPGLASGYVFPLQGPHDFGDRLARFGAARYGHIHEGQDLFGKTGTPEVAVHDGVVVDRGKNTNPDSGGRGNYLTIYSPQDDHSFVYMHMLKPPPVVVGDHVHAGQVIGRLGCTGTCEGPHLHFEVRVGKAAPGAETKAVDPLPYLRHWPQPTPG
jgi:murein DD-endopeptidase MepM/ murein hydrolase activator NlpD